MQGQINSYSFPLANEGESSYLSTLKNKTFLVACGLSHSNQQQSQIHMFTFAEQNPKKSCSQSRSIKGKVNCLQSAEDESQQISCIVVREADKSKLQKLNLQSFEKEGEEWTQTLYEQDSKINQICFKKDLKELLLTQNNDIKLFDLEKRVATSWVHSEELITSVTMDYLHEFMAYATNSQNIVICDKKSNNEKYKIEGRKGDNILNINYNPTKQFCLMSCHHETLKIWDIRKGNLPVKCYDDHQNLLVQAKYHPCHDELVACAYDDGSVALLRLCSVCSSPQKGVEDSIVKLYDEHEDSVFKLAWSAFSSWIFATVTYDASNLAVNMVPQVQRYRILL